MGYDGKHLLLIYRIWKCGSEVVWEGRETLGTSGYYEQFGHLLHDSAH